MANKPCTVYLTDTTGAQPAPIRVELVADVDQPTAESLCLALNQGGWLATGVEARFAPAKPPPSGRPCPNCDCCTYLGCRRGEPERSTCPLGADGASVCPCTYNVPPVREWA